MAFQNAFQGGQQFQALLDQQNQSIKAEDDRQRGVQALAAEFGTSALAPAERASVLGSERADRALTGVEEQRDVTNLRTAQQDQIRNDRNAAQDRAKADEVARQQQVKATQNTVSFIKAGLKSGKSVEEILQNAAQPLAALGVTAEQLAPLAEAITNDPTVLDQFEAALTKQAGPRRAIGQPISVRLPDGSTGLMQTFSTGETEVVKGAKPLAPELAARRADIAEGRAATAAGGLQARLSENDRKTLKDTGAELTKLDEARNFNETTTNAAVTVTRDIDSIFDIADKAASFEGNSFKEAATRAVFANVISADEREIQQLIDSVKSNIGIDSLLRIKRSGAGLGQVPQSQLETLQSLLGNLNITRDPKLFKRDIRDVKKTYADVIEKARVSTQRIDKRELQLRRRRGNIEQRNFGDEAPAQESIEDILNRLAPAPTGG